jgi:hypothetical protein
MIALTAYLIDGANLFFGVAAGGCFGIFGECFVRFDHAATHSGNGQAGFHQVNPRRNLPAVRWSWAVWIVNRLV